MKKLLFVLGLSFSLLAMFSSCKKCEECEAKDNGTVVDSEDKCGNSAEVKTWEDSYKLSWETFGYDVSCSKK
jgi:hypothetical protein